MIFSIYRKKYDTDNDVLLAVAKKSFGTYGENPNNDWTETLYLKGTNEYYLYGKGGKNTPYPEEGGKITVWKKGNYASARSWVKDNCPEKMDSVFSEENKKITSTISISQRAKLNLKQYSDEHEIPISEIIERYALSLYK